MSDIHEVHIEAWATRLANQHLPAARGCDGHWWIIDGDDLLCTNCRVLVSSREIARSIENAGPKR